MKESQLQDLHKQSFKNTEIVKKCGDLSCFYCLKNFSFGDVKDFVDQGQTALCPFCSIDSVICRVDDATLFEMNNRWFK